MRPRRGHATWHGSGQVPEAFSSRFLARSGEAGHAAGWCGEPDQALMKCEKCPSVPTPRPRPSRKGVIANNPGTRAPKGLPPATPRPCQSALDWLRSTLIPSGLHRAERPSRTSAMPRLMNSRVIATDIKTEAVGAFVAHEAIRVRGTATERTYANISAVALCAA